jgi:hypothetical protein
MLSYFIGSDCCYEHLPPHKKSVCIWPHHTCYGNLFGSNPSSYQCQAPAFTCWTHNFRYSAHAALHSMTQSSFSSLQEAILNAHHRGKELYCLIINNIQEYYMIQKEGIGMQSELRQALMGWQSGWRILKRLHFPYRITSLDYSKWNGTH